MTPPERRECAANLEGSAPTVYKSRPESCSQSAVTNSLIGGYQLTRILTLRNGSKNQIPGIWRNLKVGEISFKELERTHGTRKLRNNCFVSSTKLDVLTFGDFYNHEFLAKENVITPYPGNIIERIEAGK